MRSRRRRGRFMASRLCVHLENAHKHT
jgi:hypothetical protein